MAPDSGGDHALERKVDALDAKVDAQVLATGLLTQAVEALTKAVGTFVLREVYEADKKTQEAHNRATSAQIASILGWGKAIGLFIILAVLGGLVGLLFKGGGLGS